MAVNEGGEAGEVLRQRSKVGAQVVIVQNGSVLLGLRTGDRFGAGTWGLVGGLVEQGEAPEEAIRREVLEETGESVSLSDFSSVRLHVAPADVEPFVHEQHGFVLPWGVGVPGVREEGKCAEFRFFPLDALPEKVFGPSELLIKQYKEVLLKK